MNNILISVIVPVYNAERYLRKCMDSILSQTFKEIELILVNDGSTDQSKKIIEDYVQKDSRIRALHKNNGGVSKARNVAIKLAKGRYIAFVDADDFISNNYLEKLFTGIQANQNLSVINGLTKFNSQGNYFRETRLTKGQFNLRNNPFNIEYIPFYKNGFAGGKLFVTEIIKTHGILFNEKISFSEDLIFLYTYLVHVDNISIIESSDYFYNVPTLKKGSLSSSYSKFDAEYLLYKTFLKLIEVFAKQNNIEKESLKDNIFWCTTFFVRSLKAMYRSKNRLSYKERIQVYKAVIREDDYRIFQKYYRPESKIDKLIYVLINKKRFYILDCFLSLLFKLRYNVFLLKIYSRI